MKQKLLYLLALVMMVFTSSCEDPEYVAPTVNRQGITSISAIFTEGQYKGLELARFTLGEGEEIPETIIIPVPYYYPETSDNETEQYMTNVRVQAELAPNCSLSPALTTLDLTKENKFVYTDPQGNAKNIVIKGERVKSAACELLEFSIVSPETSGIIDNAAKTVTLNTGRDLSSCLAEYQVSAHATIENDPAVNPRNYNDEVIIKVVAHDGVTYSQYKVIKAETAKIPQGFDPNSFKVLFNIDPVAMLEVNDYTVEVGPTLGVVKNKLVYCEGDGTTPIYINGLTGAKEGEIVLGAAEAGSVTNDEGGHLLIMNKVAEADAMVNIYMTGSVKDEPTLLTSFANPYALPLGSKFKVIGDVQGDALIVIPVEGVAGITTASNVIYIPINDGVVGEIVTDDLASVGFNWDSAPVGTAGMCAVSTNLADGILYSKYGGTFSHIINGTALGNFSNDTSGWGLNPNCLDSKTFNNVRYAALFVVSHFPAWGIGPEIYLYNITDMTQFTGSSVTDLANLVYTEDFDSWSQDGAYSIASGDVVIAPTADGYTMYIYFVDHNSQMLGGYSVDCIQR